MSPLRFVRPVLLPLSLLLWSAAVPVAAQVDVDPASVDAVFRDVDNTRSPGCAVAVSRGGIPILQRAYGMADLEHDVPNTPTTVFEPGSVSKQFTSTATILLALDGVISLDDDIRKYFPELPDYGDVVTVRHLLNHTSGLRDWGSVAGIEGWPRTRRAHTHTHVLDILSRQQELNYRPGDYYSYTNSGYNLQAMLVARVSGMTFAEFSRKRIFEPLGMTHTQWRDDFNRIVKDRAVAYRRGDEGWEQLMPFEDVHGNGGLLTTVEDLLKFTRNLETGALGGPLYLEEMHRQGVLNSGQVIAYASGLRVESYKGVRQVSHSGSTAGYRGHLARFPDQGLAVAVMCNNAGNAGGYLYQVADLYLGSALDDGAPAPPRGAPQLPADRLQALEGTYRDTRTGGILRLTAAEGSLRLGGTRLVPVGGDRFVSPGETSSLVFERSLFADGRPAAVLDRPDHPGVRIEPVVLVRPTSRELADYVGTYRNDEAEATYRVEVRDGALALVNRWGEARSLSPLYRDAFDGRESDAFFQRDAAGAVTGFVWSESRVWGMKFRKVEE